MRDVVTEMYLAYAPFVPGLLEKAESLVAEQTQGSPTNIVYQFNLGSVTLMKRDWPKAISVFTEVLDVVPEYDSARFNRAIANLQSGNFDAARADYEALLEKAPHEFKIRYGLGEIAVKQNRANDALEHFEAYLKAAPRNTAEYTNTVRRVEQLKAK
jgi:tetratricopeptide (TPR) repeat protein